MSTKMSVTRALVELKTLDTQINRAVTQGVFVTVTKGLNDQKVVNDGKRTSVEDATRQIQGSFDKVSELIERRQKIKSAIVKSNANTLVQIAGRQMSVAEAIELKTSIANKQDFLAALQRQIGIAVHTVETSNKALDEQINKLLESTFGKDKKVTEEESKVIVDSQKKTKVLEVLDPFNIQKKIEELNSEIESVTSQLDFILSESNAKTEIEV